MSSRLPHSFMLQDLVHRNASSVIFTAKYTPKVKMDVFEVRGLENNLWRIRVRLVNEGVMYLSHPPDGEKINCTRLTCLV